MLLVMGGNFSFDIICCAEKDYFEHKVASAVKW